MAATVKIDAAEAARLHELGKRYLAADPGKDVRDSFIRAVVKLLNGNA